MNTRAEKNTSSSKERILALLEPLKKEHTSAEYMHQLKVLSDLDKNFRSLELFYEGLHSRVISLQEKLESCKNF